MKSIAAKLFSGFCLFTSAAFAGEAQGVITAVDTNSHSMMLDDGKTYALPEGFDISLIGEGMVVALAFDEVDGENRVTDMEQVN